MIRDSLIVRELETGDLGLFMSYWFDADESFLRNMGVDIKKLPTKQEFLAYWKSQLVNPIDKRLSYCVIWQMNNTPVGHSSTRPVNFGKDAYMHLHLWNSQERRKGLGYEFLRQTVLHYFEKLQLKDLYCEPYALNPAPNRLLEKLGFDFVKRHRTIPGPSNFEQEVNLWHLSHRKFVQLYKSGI